MVAGLIEKRNLKVRPGARKKRLASIFKKKIVRSDSILRYPLFVIRYSAVFRSRLQRDSLFNNVVSYKQRRWPQASCHIEEEVSNNESQ
jgi:hypothetical protein